MLRITFIAISVFLLLQNSGDAQQTSDWLQPQIDVPSPLMESSESVPRLAEDLFPEELWEQPAELAVRRFKKQAVQTVTFKSRVENEPLSQRDLVSDLGCLVLAIHP